MLQIHPKNISSSFLVDANTWSLHGSRARAWLSALNDMLRLIGCPLPDSRESTQFLSKYTEASYVDLGETFLKYHMTFIFCHVMHQPLPERPIELPVSERDGYLVWPLWTFFKSRLFVPPGKEANPLQMKIVYSLCQFKKACPPISQEAVEQKRAETLIALTKLPPTVIIESEEEALYRSIDDIVALLKPDRSLMLLDECGTSDSHRPSRVPSASAHFGHSRKSGGALGVLARDTEFSGPDGILDSIREVRPGKLIELRHIPSRFLVRECREELLDGRLGAEVHVVLEPFKARFITTGPPKTYHLARLVQKVWHTQLRQHPIFCLIGETATERVLNEAFIGTSHFGSKFESGDYKDATNNVSSVYGQYILNKSLSRLGVSIEAQMILSKTLTDYRIEGLREGSAEMQNGQLMGSPLSFLVLCMLNAALILTAYRLSGYEFDLSEAPIRVNGDDCLFRCDGATSRKWKELATQIGLAISPGKSYRSKHFVMINSRLFKVDPCFEAGELSMFRYIPYYNLGLLRGQGRVLSDTRRPNPSKDCVGPSMLAGAARDLLNGHPSTKHEQMMKLFVQRRKGEIERVSRRWQSWFLPGSLGGVGLPQTRRRSLTYTQKCVASLCARDGGGLDMGVLGKPAYLARAGIEEVALMRARGFRQGWRVGRSERPCRASQWWPLGVDLVHRNGAEGESRVRQALSQGLRDSPWKQQEWFRSHCWDYMDPVENTLNKNVSYQETCERVDMSHYSDGILAGI